MDTYCSLDEAIEQAKQYLRNDIVKPFFVAFSTPEVIIKFCDAFSSSCKIICLSDYCTTKESFPDDDTVINDIRNSKGKNVLLLGLGEYTALHGGNDLLLRFSGPRFEKVKIIVPLWNGYKYLEGEQKADPRLNLHNIIYTQPSRLWRFKLIAPHIPFQGNCCNGFKELLRRVEKGCDSEVIVQTRLRLNDVFGFYIKSSHDMYVAQNPGDSAISENMFSEQQWSRFLNPDRVISDRIDSEDRFLEFLSSPQKRQNKPYLQLVLNNSENYSSYQKSLFNAILSIPVSDPQFKTLYSNRKELIKDISSEYVHEYIKQTQVIEGSDRICYLTDNTLQERLEIIKTITYTHSIPENLQDYYPDLAAYLEGFVFTHQHCQSEFASDFATELTYYINRYKEQKLFNRLDDDFISLVEDFAHNRPYYMLESRGSIVDKIKENNKNNKIFLYWIDALGCEYISYIKSECDKYQLGIKISLGRAEPPTITSANKDFFDSWDNDTREKNEKLDNIKHGGGNFDNLGFDTKSMPVHLPYELEALNEAIKRVSQKLITGNYDRVLIASDHGASRLAVLSQSEKWKMQSKGEHSGRCCPASEVDGSLPESVTQDAEKKWYVLANYDRFSGSRAADVEVHGGAALEEIVVPIIEVFKRSQTVTVSLHTKKYCLKPKEESVILDFYISEFKPDISAIFENNRYQAIVKPNTTNIFQIILPRLKTGKYSISVLSDDTIIGIEEFEVIGAGVQINNDSDFF